MLYFVQINDSLGKIAARFRTTVQAIMQANVICNPTLVFVGQPLIIPESNLHLPKAGIGPYYIVQPGDTLNCISQQAGISIHTLININQVQNPNLIYPGMELLVISPTTDDPEQLKLDWEGSPDESCMVYGFTEHGVYYIGSFEWVAFGGDSIDYLLELLNNRCDIVRRYAVISLGRLALNGRVRKALIPLLQDSAVSDVVKLSIRRIDLGAMGLYNIHVTLTDNKLLSQPNLLAPSMQLPVGSEIRVMRYFIPSPTGEEGPRGGIQVYDYVRITKTGQVGFIPRFGFTEITFM